MRTEEFVWLHGAYVLDCSPRRRADGGFEPHATAALPSCRGLQSNAIPLPRKGTFSTASEAAEFALQYAMRWADSQH